MARPWCEIRDGLDWDSLLKRCQQRLMEEQGELTDGLALERIEGEVLPLASVQSCSHEEKGKIVRRLFFRLRRDLDFLAPYADDPQVTEIMVNGPERIFVERQGEMIRLEEGFDSVEQLEQLIRRIGTNVHREINEANPILDARLEDGSRVSAIYKNIALDGPILTIRRFPRTHLTMEDLIRWGTITREAAYFLEELVKAGYNIFLSGRTNSGKTTMLSVLMNFIPAQERIIVIEDSAELQVDHQSRNVVRMETRSANVQGKGKISIGDLIRASLRMRPDRIIVGEVRGGEVVEMIGAMQTGHDGSLSTGHGNSPAGMLRRMEAMFLSAVDYPVDSIRAQIAEAVDIIVHMDRLWDRSRRVMEIVEVLPCEGGEIGLHPLFRFIPERGLVAVGDGLKRKEKLDMRRRYAGATDGNAEKRDGVS